MPPQADGGVANDGAAPRRKGAPLHRQALIAESPPPAMLDLQGMSQRLPVDRVNKAIRGYHPVMRGSVTEKPEFQQLKQLRGFYVSLPETLLGPL